MKVAEIAARLGMEPHPEGGFYKRNYESDDMTAVDDRYAEPRERHCSTSIYYLLRRDDFSAWHRLKSDEQWHHYEGNPVIIRTIDPSTKALEEHRLGKVSEGATPQILIRHGLWFCAEPVGDDEGSLVGCTVTPGFDFKDFELADRAALTAEHPEHKAMIARFTRIAASAASTAVSSEPTSEASGRVASVMKSGGIPADAPKAAEKGEDDDAETEAQGHSGWCCCC